MNVINKLGNDKWSTQSKSSRIILYDSYSHAETAPSKILIFFYN